METQREIGRTLAEPKNLDQLHSLAQQRDWNGPMGFTRKVCEHFGFLDPLHRPQKSSCLAALRKLESRGLITLPASPKKVGGLVKPVRLEQPVEPPRGVPETVKEIAELSLELVENREQRAVWNELVIREHPQGQRALVGRLLRYLVRSEHGYLGALGFSSSALKLAPRDQWLGWDPEGRGKHLDRVVSLSRFLIRPCVSCRHLASKVLGMVVKRVRDDYKLKYGLDILLLETFVDRSLYRGTCFRAANWIGVGQTQGRGRQDRDRTTSVGIKDIYMYPLHRSFRRLLGVEDRQPALGISEGLDGPNWVRHEFGGARVGHVGRVERLIQMAEGKSRKPNASWLEVVEGDRQQLKGIYRFLDKPDKSNVTMEGILEGHQNRTRQRMAGQRVVLCVQDSTDLEFSDLLKCQGLGFVGKNQTSAVAKGLRLHSTLAFSEEGIPLGVLWAECKARKELEEALKDRDSRMVPIEKKESYRWLQSLETCIDASKQMPETMLVNIMDREGDIFDLYYRAVREPRVKLLVRAKNDRRMGEVGRLFEHVKASQERAEIEVCVPRQSARRKSGNRKAREKIPSRRAKASLRYMPCTIDPPQHGLNAQKKPVDAWIIHVQEKNAPEGVEPIEWYLLTTLPIDSVATAVKLVKWYCIRWRIEDWHRVLKSGCEIEAHANHTAERLKRAIAIDLVVAYRIMLMVLLGRELPELPAEVLFSDLELRVLSEWAGGKKKQTPVVTTIAQAIAIVAAMGGYLARKSDPPVGPKILRRGYTRLQDLCEGYALANATTRLDE